MKKYLRRIFSAFALVAACILFVSCGGGEVKVEKVSVIPDTVPNSILTTEVDQKIAGITLRVTMSDGTTKEVKVTKDMIPAEDYAKLSTASETAHVIKVVYEGVTVTVNIVIAAPVQEIEGDKVTYTDELIANNLKDLDEVPAEYELYAWVWGGSTENIFVPCKSGEVTVPTGTPNLLFAFFAKGCQNPNWDSPDKLGQTNNLRIVDGKVTDEIPEVGDTYEYTIDVASIEANLKDGATMPEEFITYAWVWGGAAGGLWVSVDATGKFETASDITNCLFVLFPVDVEKIDWDFKLAQTVDYAIAWDADKAAHIFTFTEVTSDLTTIEANLKDGATMPEEYDLFVWVWGGSTSAFIPVAADGKFNAPTGSTGGTFVLFAKDEENRIWDNKLAQTGDYDIVDGVASPKA
ncbi:MAG: hypothetical protein K2O22_01170 [Anaeroplasmataceae bacterium]|nr:hypothetical protein [Anaeroplasmataceae bacterium]